MNPQRPRSWIGRQLEAASHWAARWTGSAWAFSSAVAVVVVWLLTGRFFHYSDTWQLVINTGTTIVTFLMVFLIQRAQNKDALAIQLKLNELVAAMDTANNRLIDIENLDEDDLDVLHEHYRQLAELSKREQNIATSHSVHESVRRHHRKMKAKGA